MTIEFSQIMQMLAFAVSAGGALYSWVASRDKATALAMRELELRFNAFEARVAKHDGDQAGRLAKIEADTAQRISMIDVRLASMPDQSVVHKLELGMGDLRAAVDQMKDQWGAIERTIHRLEDFLLDARDAREREPRRTGRRT